MPLDTTVDIEPTALPREDTPQETLRAARSPASPAAPSGERTSERRGGLIFAAACLGGALLSSGAAGLINQVVWQRSLKVFLGGSDTICSTVVVLVFMAGLGIGSIWMGYRASRLRNPLRTFGMLETALAIVNVGICGILAADFSHSVFAMQQLAVSLGVPLLLLYGVGAACVLIVPCLLMGATMPLAAEVCQRNFGLQDSRLLGGLFFINTFGSVVGTVVSAGYMISHWGLSLSLLAASGMNLLAGLSLLILCGRMPVRSPAIGTVSRAADPASPAVRDGHRFPANGLAFGLGFCSLGYEMFLFRLIPLKHQPLPFTFAAVLAGFLTFWSIGAALSSRRRTVPLVLGLRLCGLTAAATMAMFAFDALTPITGTWSLVTFVLWKTPYFLPCVGFGYLFGLVARHAAVSWGHDVGRLYAFNTCGSCLGILAMTFVGYEMPFYLMLLVIVLLLFAMQEFVEGLTFIASGRRVPRWTAPLAAAALATALPFLVDMTGALPGQTIYSGRDGVIVIDDDGNLQWDGLWHSKLSRNGDHLGTNNWMLAVCPVLCHPTGDIEDACVIGVATGITASTLAKLESVRRVDGYDITRVLEDIYRNEPEGTLGLAHNEKIRLIWQDARSGLALNPQRYDVIQTQPLYLKQAGSGLLNSVEFYELVSRRLKPGGVFCLYSNGTAEQALIVRETARRVFPHAVSFFNGYLVVLSNDPIEMTAAHLRQRLSQSGEFWDEVRGTAMTADAERILALIDRPPLQPGDGSLVTTDDHPLIEYPQYLAQLVRDRMPDLPLPTPMSGRVGNGSRHGDVSPRREPPLTDIDGDMVPSHL